MYGCCMRARCRMSGMEHFAWKTVNTEKMSETISRKVITGEKAMVAQVFLLKGAVVPPHQHESEQIVYILEGALHIPSQVPHSAVALEDTLDLDIFSPIRTDWLKGQDDYLRRG